eukprot:scaffold1033_cov205-Alexandrium_tamarense.AAC.4
MSSLRSHQEMIHPLQKKIGDGRQATEKLDGGRKACVGIDVAWEGDAMRLILISSEVKRRPHAPHTHQMMKKRHAPGRSPAHQHDDDTDRPSKDAHFHKQEKPTSSSSSYTVRRYMLPLLCTAISWHLLTSLLHHLQFNSSSANDRLKYYSFSSSHADNINNSTSHEVSPFTAKLEHLLISNIAEGKLGFFVPLVLENGRLLCRKKHRYQLSAFRTRFVAQMIRRGLELQKKKNKKQDSTYNSIPIIVMDVDGNGCNIAAHRDDFPFPRLTWSTPSQKHGDKSWCNVIGMPSYETWKYYHRTHSTYLDWEATFVQNEVQYPWSRKLDKAIWRGSTTYEVSQYGDATSLQDIPRGQLVQLSREHPELIDAGFHKINQKFEKRKQELKGETNVVRRMVGSDMMRYKEYFYEDIQPNVHYIAASLDNLTETVAYVMDKRNEEEMQQMIKSANNWCKKSLSEEGLAKDSLIQLDRYRQALDDYDMNWSKEWMGVRKQFTETIDDLVDCDAWSFVDVFANPSFAGL